MAQVLDIYLLRVRPGHCNDIRPCIVTSIANGGVAVMALVSSALSMKRSTDFLILDTHPDFRATGLTRTSFVLADKIIDVPVEELTLPIGRLDNLLAIEFRNWFGI